MKCRFATCENKADESIRPYVYNNMCRDCFKEYMEMLRCQEMSLNKMNKSKNILLKVPQESLDKLSKHIDEFIQAHYSETVLVPKEANQIYKSAILERLKQMNGEFK